MEKRNVKSLIFGLVAGIAGGGITTIGAILGLTTADAIWAAFAIGAVMGALVHNAKQSITHMIDNRLGTLKNRVEKIRRDVGDIHGLVRLGPYTQDLPLPMGGGWALTGDSAALLAREVLARKPETILELGSGVSTLILGQILKRNGRGRLLSVDHDPEWANQTRRFVEFLGLGDVVTVVDAPLKEIAAGSQAANWYDIPKSSLDTLGAIDILLVDGPPQAQDNPQAARYPAFPCATRPPVGACANIRGRCQPQDRVENGRAVANRRLGMAVAVVRHRRWRLHPYQKTIIGIMRT